MFEEIAGNLEGAAFRVELINRHPKSPKIEKRFFTEDEQLFHLNGNTWNAGAGTGGTVPLRVAPRLS